MPGLLLPDRTRVEIKRYRYGSVNYLPRTDTSHQIDAFALRNIRNIRIVKNYNEPDSSEQWVTSTLPKFEFFQNGYPEAYMNEIIDRCFIKKDVHLLDDPTEQNIEDAELGYMTLLLIKASLKYRHAWEHFMLRRFNQTGSALIKVYQNGPGSRIRIYIHDLCTENSFNVKWRLEYKS